VCAWRRLGPEGQGADRGRTETGSSSWCSVLCLCVCIIMGCVEKGPCGQESTGPGTPKRVEWGAEGGIRKTRGALRREGTGSAVQKVGRWVGE